MAAVQPASIHGTGGAAVTVTVNGDRREVREGTTVGQLVTAITALTGGVAAAVNGDVLPRGSWAARALRDGDRVEVVTAIQGG
jgi:sulfur carrier protein